MTDEEIDDYDYVDSDEEDETYYLCYCCNYSCVERPAFGCQCPKCGSIMNEEIL